MLGLGTNVLLSSENSNLYINSSADLTETNLCGLLESKKLELKVTSFAVDTMFHNHIQ